MLVQAHYFSTSGFVLLPKEVPIRLSIEMQHSALSTWLYFYQIAYMQVNKNITERQEFLRLGQNT
jgi:hypothetical protein